jgi:hypothetical protein
MVDRANVSLDSPGAVEDFLFSGSKKNAGATAGRETIIAALEECTRIWEAGYAAGDVAATKRFVERSYDVLDEHARCYQEVMRSLFADASFLRVVAQEGGRAAHRSHG